MKVPKVDIKTAAMTVIGVFVVVGPMLGFDFKDWNPANPNDLYRVIPTLIVTLVVCFVLKSSPDADSAAKLKKWEPIVQEHLERCQAQSAQATSDPAPPKKL